MCNWTSSRDVCAYHTLEIFSCVTRYRARRNESGIVNLNNATESGNDWIAYAKRNNHALWQFRPPKELMRYFGNSAMIEYNRVLSDIRSELLRTDVWLLRFLQMVDAHEFKKLDEVLWNLNISRMLFPVANTYAEWEEHRPRGEYTLIKKFPEFIQKIQNIVLFIKSDIVPFKVLPMTVTLLYQRLIQLIKVVFQIWVMAITSSVWRFLRLITQYRT